MTDVKTQIETLIAKAATAEFSVEALNYAQAAVNVANALHTLTAATILEKNNG